MRTGRAIYAVVPEMTIFRGLPMAEGERTAIALVCFQRLDVLVASHLRWPKTAEFYVCASTAAQRGDGGIWTPLVPARRYCDTDLDLPSANVPPRRDIAAGAFWRRRRVRALVAVCARQTRPHVTLRCHLTLPLNAALLPLHSEPN